MEKQEKQAIEENLKIENKIKSRASLFFLIAGASISNLILLLADREGIYIIGLGTTYIIHGIGLEASKDLGNLAITIAFVFQFLVAGIFIIFGAFAIKGNSWAFIIGMILYALDGLIFLSVLFLLPFGLHIFVLFFIYGGFKANKSLKSIEKNKSI